jgi:hypothetical protein
MMLLVGFAVVGFNVADGMVVQGLLQWFKR